MRYFYLTASIIFTVIILIVGFENVQAQCNYISVFFTEISPQTAPTFLAFGMAALGIVTGACYFGFINAFFSQNEEDEDAPSDW